MYEWIVTEHAGRKRAFKFSGSKTIDFHSRPNGQFTIIVKESKDTTQLLGKLDKTECIALSECMDCIRMQVSTPKPQRQQQLQQQKQQNSSGSDWLCVKENLPSTINNCTKTPNKSMTKIVERNSSSATSLLTNNTPFKTHGDTPKDSGGLRTPLGDKPVVPVQRNHLEGTRLFPSAEQLRATVDVEKDADDDSDTDVQVTAIGMCFVIHSLIFCFCLFDW